MVLRPSNSLIVLSFFAFAVTSPACAELISFEFTGKVGAEVIDPLLNFPTIKVGTEVRGTLQYDTDIPETFGGIDPAYGFYDATPPFDVLSITVGTTTFSGSSLLPPTVIVANDIQDPVVGEMTDLFSVIGDIVSVSAEFDGLMTAIGIGMLSTDLDALESNALPEYFDFELFEFSSFFSMDWPRAVKQSRSLASSTHFSGRVTRVGCWPAMRIKMAILINSTLSK